MRLSSVLVGFMVLLALAGGLINMQLARMHVREAPTEGMFADVCAPQAMAGFDCKKVVKSKWSVLPPNEADPVTGEQAGVPVAMLGWWYFTGVGLWYLLVGRCDYQRRGWHLLLLLAVVAGCLVSLFYLYILYFTPMPAKCLWCIISHGINFAVLIGTLVLLPRRPRAAPAAAPLVGGGVIVDAQAAGAPGQGGLAPAPASAPAPVVAPVVVEPAHPTGRLVAAAVVAVIAMSWCEFKMLQAEARGVMAATQKRLASACKMVVDDFYRDDEALWKRFESQTPVEVALRPDDPARGTGKMLLPMVVFSDFQCPACRDFADKLEKVINPDFDHLLHVYWKNLPLNTDCNSNALRTLHPQACEAAYAAEAARVLGGNDAFWKAHDRLFADQVKLPQFDYRALAGELDLDPDRFVETMHSDAVKERIHEDVEQARELEVRATPSIFLWGRRVDRNMLANPTFVKRIAERFQQVRQQQLAKQKWEQMSPKERAEFLRKAEEEIKAKASPAPAAADGHDHDHGDAPAESVIDPELP